MTLRDHVSISLGNLRRMKLRTFLTSSGIVIAIGAFVAMLSFGAGSQQNVEREYENLGLLTMMQVSPQKAGTSEDTSHHSPLDDAAIQRISTIRGVRMAYPYDAITVRIDGGDTVRSAKAQALPSGAFTTRLHARLLAGRTIASDSAREVVLSEDIVRELGYSAADSAVGKRLVLTVRVSTVDSALARVLRGDKEGLFARIRRLHLDSLLDRGYRTRILRQEANEALRNFVSGYLSSQEAIRETVIVAGVRESRRTGPMKLEPVAMTIRTARSFTSRGPVGGAQELFAAMSRGDLFTTMSGAGPREYPSVSVSVDPRVPYRSVRDSIQALGFRVFSFAEQFENLQRFFLFFDVGLAIIGMIALLTASLGIVNTMVMSVIERRKEIGILKSLGADDRDIRWLFLVESGTLGTLGTTMGIILGWLVTRLLSLAGQAYLAGQGLPEMEFFAIPAWLIFVALAVGIGVSVLAGTYPAGRAARLDPVEALRGE